MVKPDAIHNPAANRKGSIILIAVMILAILTVIALISSESMVTENFIIRNEAIYHQNLNMAEAATMEGLQRFMQIAPDNSDIVDVKATNLPWINDIHSSMAAIDWYAVNSSQRILDAANSIPISTAKNLADRGEAASGNLRCAFVGWETVALPGGGSESLGVGANKPVWREGRLLSEYESFGGGGADHGYGMVRMEIGIKRRIVIN